MNTLNPWAGLASYEDPEKAEHKLKFCGRDDESYDVAKLIMGNIFITLYGKSGIGKTSLLNAGVFPELREEHYTPISLRLGMRDEKNTKSYQSRIVEEVAGMANRQETFNVVDEQTDHQAIDYLWNFFARHRFYDKDDEPIMPVFVFDQFEEVFRSDSKEAETLLRQLDYINDKDHALDSCTVDGKPYRYETNFRFVVSIREDDLYRLEDCLDNCYLPALKRCRYRLRSLSEDGARDVILLPGEGLFTSDEQPAIVENIIAKSRNKDGSISTNIISLLCSRIYADYQQSNADHITLSVVDSFLKDEPIERFYQEATAELSYRVRRKLENNLITEGGHRKYIELSTFESYLPDKALRERLLDSNFKILQRVNISSQHDVDGVELIHDSFCEAILSLRQKKQAKMQHRIYIVLLLLLLFLVGETVYVMCSSPNEKNGQPIKSWFVRLDGSSNIDGYSWRATVSIKDEFNKTIMDSININSSNWNDTASVIKLTPDSTIRAFRVLVVFHEGKDKFLPVEDTVVYVNNTNDSLVIREIRENWFHDTLTVQTEINIDSCKPFKLPVRNATIMVKGGVGHTDANGKCHLKLRYEINNNDTILILREGYLSKCKQWREIKNKKEIIIQKEVDDLNQAWSDLKYLMEYTDRLKEVDSLNFEQKLLLKRDGKDNDTIYLRAYVDKKIDIPHDKNKKKQQKVLKKVMGYYYYRSKCRQVKKPWKNIPPEKIYLLEGYIDESQSQNGNFAYFFEGTDMANNKEQFLGVLKGDAKWKDGKYIIPGENGISGTFNSISNK